MTNIKVASHENLPGAILADRKVFRFFSWNLVGAYQSALPQKRIRSCFPNIRSGQDKQMRKEHSPKADENVQLAEWISDTSKGIEASFVNLYASTADMVYGLAHRIVGIPSVAEDVVVSTYLYAWQHAAQFDVARGNAITWLLVICRSQALMQLRDPEIKTAVYLDDDVLKEGTSADTDPQSLLAAVEEKAALHAVLETLRPCDRQILALAFFRGLTYAEIGMHLDMPIGTVKTRMRSAIDTLRTQLKPLRCSHGRT
ncbi:RNA polymerase sigma factor [Noviherbaspirillum saxi]|uniref:RNA polymerase sigma factor n=1 Tax=Noviherbaspirillum saxi TaxID=2320863 RepID=UPI001314FB24|nr:sigma-70 family RNA polymerase sigma factor [Noviherbaspirillum saxi]